MSPPPRHVKTKNKFIYITIGIVRVMRSKNENVWTWRGSVRSAWRWAVCHALSPAVGLNDVSSCKWSSVSRRGRRVRGEGPPQGARPHPQHGASPSQGREAEGRRAGSRGRRGRASTWGGSRKGPRSGEAGGSGAARLRPKAQAQQNKHKTTKQQNLIQQDNQ